MASKHQEETVNLVAEASAAGARSSGWYRLGDGPWHGTVVYADPVPDSDSGRIELDVEELKDGWSVTDETGQRSTARQLQTALHQALKKATG